MSKLVIAVDNSGQNPLLVSFMEQHDVEQSETQFDIKLIDIGQGIELHEYHQDKNDKRKLRKHFIDVEKITKQQRSFPAAKQGAFNQALGKSKTVIDATGGWGGDALLMCTQNYQVVILERHPVMVLLLQDAMQRLANTPWAKQNKVIVPKVINTNAIAYFSNTFTNTVSVDCIYLDPMFPPKRKQSALANKGIQFLHKLVGEDADAKELLMAAQQTKARRIVVKRPDYAQALGGKPDQQFSSKLLHYDVYYYK